MDATKQKLAALERLPCSLRELAGALAAEHVGLVRTVAHKVKEKVPMHVDLDDLVSDGQEGLLQAALSFDPSRGIKFTSYAVQRIRGAMLDGLRERDPTSRLARISAAKLAAATEAITQTMGRRPTEEEIRDRLGWSEGQLEQAARVCYEQSIARPMFESTRAGEVPLSALLVDPKGEPRRFERGQWFDRVTRGLCFENRMVLYLYHIKGATMKEIGRLLDLSESRISQLHSRLTEDLSRRIDRAEAFASMPKAV